MTLAAALLAAQNDRNHPLVTLAAREPDALEFFEEFGRLRIDASHDTYSVARAEVARTHAEVAWRSSEQGGWVE